MSWKTTSTIQVLDARQLFTLGSRVCNISEGYRRGVASVNVHTVDAAGLSKELRIARRFSAGKYLSWGGHYVTTGKREKNRMSLGLWFSPRRPHHEALTMTVNERLLVGGRELHRDAAGRSHLPRIPANASNWEITGTLVLHDVPAIAGGID